MLTNNTFADIETEDLLEVNGGIALTTVILGLTVATWIKIGVGALIAGGVFMFGKGVYDGYKGK